MSFEIALEEQVAWAAERWLRARGALEPSTEGERAALEGCGFFRVPVIPSASNAQLPNTSCISVTVTEPEPMAEDDLLWKARVEVLVSTLAFDDKGDPADPLKMGRVHQARGMLVQKMFSPMGGKKSLAAWANGEGGEESGVGFFTRLHGFEHAGAEYGFQGNFRRFFKSVVASYSWRG